MGEGINKERMENSAKAANIHEFIMTLPNGYNEAVGESSTLLSSGQAQRIGIARALYKNSPILIFDEPTSNLDEDAILSLHETIKVIACDKICLIVTHDALTKGICNKVYFLDGGRISEVTGTGHGLVKAFKKSA